MTTVAAFVPLKLRSRRLPNKNFLRLGDRPLAYHIFETLLGIDAIDQVYCYNSQAQVLALLPASVSLLMRPRHLDSDQVKANALFRYAVESMAAEIIVLCHATGPFISSESIQRGIMAVRSGNYDSAMAVQRHQTYCWWNNRPLNYDIADMAQTQDLIPVFSETSGFYVFRRDTYLATGTRVGQQPLLIEVGLKEAVDIDEPEDFALATHLLDYHPERLYYSRDTFFVDLANQHVPLKNIEHVAFDLDGVLVDSLPAMEIAWQAAASEFNLTPAFADYRRHIGLPFPEILAQLGIPADLHNVVQASYDRVATEHQDGIELYAGVAEALERLRTAGVRLTVVTSKCKARARALVENRFRTGLFDCVITPEDIPSGRGKPHPDPLLAACLAVGADPHNTIYVGDMDADQQTARRASVHFVYAGWGYGQLAKVRDVWFNSIDDLVAYIVED